MLLPTRPGPDAVLRGYFHAKDENRPHLLRDVFSPDAELRVDNRAASIAFPALTRGRESIADVLVRRFAQTYENVYSFYMARPPARATQFSCDWLVGMSEKDSGGVRVGCGRYDWTLQAEPPRLACRLVITIEAMQVLPPADFDAVFGWLERLDYPWSSAVAATRDAPGLELLSPVLDFLVRELGGRRAAAIRKEA